jgi:hypothetical protein
VTVQSWMRSPRAQAREPERSRGRGSDHSAGPKNQHRAPTHVFSTTMAAASKPLSEMLLCNDNTRPIKETVFNIELPVVPLLCCRRSTKLFLVLLKDKLSVCEIDPHRRLNTENWHFFCSTNTRVMEPPPSTSTSSNPVDPPGAVSQVPIAQNVDPPVAVAGGAVPPPAPGPSQETKAETSPAPAPTQELPKQAAPKPQRSHTHTHIQPQAYPLTIHTTNNNTNKPSAQQPKAKPQPRPRAAPVPKQKQQNPPVASGKNNSGGGHEDDDEGEDGSANGDDGEGEEMTMEPSMAPDILYGPLLRKQYNREVENSSVVPLPPRVIGGLRDQVETIKVCNCKRSHCLKVRSSRCGVMVCVLLALMMYMCVCIYVCMYVAGHRTNDVCICVCFPLV